MVAWQIVLITIVAAMPGLVIAAWLSWQAAHACRDMLKIVSSERDAAHERIIVLEKAASVVAEKAEVIARAAELVRAGKP